MTRLAKLYSSVVAQPRATLAFRNFVRLIKAFGFREVRQRGSHHVFDHADAGRPLIVQPRGSEAKPYQVEQFLDMVEEIGLQLEE